MRHGYLLVASNYHIQDETLLIWLFVTIASANGLGLR